MEGGKMGAPPKLRPGRLV